MSKAGQSGHSPFEPLWAPWRIEYLEAEPEPGCFLCRKRDEGRDEENLVLLRGERAFVLLNRFPYANGHLMVAPYEHEGDLTRLPLESLQEVMLLTRRAMAAIRRALQPQGYNLGINQERAAGAGLEDHLHLHIVPRWVGDTNFLAVLAGTRTIPEALAQTYRRLQEALEAQ